MTRLISAIAVAALVGASAVGIGAGVASASPAHSTPDIVAPVDWHGGHQWHDRGHGYGGGWHGGQWWYPRHWGWRW